MYEISYFRSRSIQEKKNHLSEMDLIKATDGDTKSEASMYSTSGYNSGNKPALAYHTGTYANTDKFRNATMPAYIDIMQRDNDSNHDNTPAVFSAYRH